jgi:DNA-directed RNA polymerase subunit beta
VTSWRIHHHSEWQAALARILLWLSIHGKGGNYEDAILISERLVQADNLHPFTLKNTRSKRAIPNLDLKKITRDIPNVRRFIKYLDEQGIIRIVAELAGCDSGRQNHTERRKRITAEERLLRAIFGEKSRDV